MTRTCMILFLVLMALPAVLAAQEATEPTTEASLDELLTHGRRFGVAQDMKRLALAISGRYATRRFVCPLGSELSDPEPADLPPVLLGVDHGMVAARGGKAIDILVSTVRGAVHEALTESPRRDPEELFDEVMMNLGLVFLGPTTRLMMQQLANQLKITLPESGDDEVRGPGPIKRGLMNLLGGQKPNNDYVQLIGASWQRILAFEQEFYRNYQHLPSVGSGGEVAADEATATLLDEAPADLHWYDYLSDYDGDTGDDEALAPINLRVLAYRSVYAGMFLDDDEANSLRFAFDDDTNNQIYHTFFYAWIRYFSNVNVAVNAGNAVHEDEDGGSRPDFKAGLGGNYLGKIVRQLRDAKVEGDTKRLFLAALPSVFAAVFAREGMLPRPKVEWVPFRPDDAFGGTRPEFVCPGGWYGHLGATCSAVPEENPPWVSPPEWANPDGLFTIDTYAMVSEIDRDLTNKLDKGLVNPLEFLAWSYVFLRKMIHVPHDIGQCPDSFCMPDRDR